MSEIPSTEQTGPSQLLRNAFDEVMEDFLAGKCPNGEPTTEQLLKLLPLAQKVGSNDLALKIITMPSISLPGVKSEDREKKLKDVTVFRSKLAVKIQSALVEQ